MRNIWVICAKDFAAISYPRSPTCCCHVASIFGFFFWNPWANREYEMQAQMKANRFPMNLNDRLYGRSLSNINVSHVFYSMIQDAAVREEKKARTSNCRDFAGEPGVIWGNGLRVVLITR